MGDDIILEARVKGTVITTWYHLVTVSLCHCQFEITDLENNVSAWCSQLYLHCTTCLDDCQLMILS